MKAILHAGMPKTGSSSIQQTFSKIDLEKNYYMDGLYANHSPLHVLLFEESPEKHRAFRYQGLGVHELTKLRSYWLKKLDEKLSAMSFDKVIYSAERIVKSDENSVRRMRDYFNAYCDEIEVFAYVRPPISFLQSRFQQRVKTHGAKTINLDDLWPHYRKGFEMLDRVFGRKRVTLKKFDPALFPDRNVVLDFSKEIGVPVSRDQTVRVNESLSLEALALLFVQRCNGDGLVTGFRAARAANQQFIKVLRKIGKEKLIFSAGLVNPVIARHKSDLDWMEKRLECELVDQPGQGEGTITCSQDLIEIAWANRDILYEVIVEKIRKRRRVRNIKDLSSNLDLLRWFFFDGADN